MFIFFIFVDVTRTFIFITVLAPSFTPLKINNSTTMVVPLDDSQGTVKGHLYHNLATPQKKQSQRRGPIQTHNNNNNNIQRDHFSNNTRNQTQNGNINVSTGEPIDSMNQNPSQLQQSPFQNGRSINMSHNPQRQKKQKICHKCQKPIIGTLVRALNNVYHIECFTCFDCGKQCSQKFFSMEFPSNEDPNLLKPYPLCEYDYFKRLDVICYKCDSAIRGSYITALGHKYHPEHFYCDVCHKLFDSDDYYANNDKIYCHYHYSQMHAFNCAGCHSAILKQYVELHRGDIDQQWHPECFMVHKFWNVDITIEYTGLGINSLDEVRNSENSSRLLMAENFLEKLTVDIWCTLSEFEESCACCISEMLHSTTLFNKERSLSCAAHLVLKIETLFKAFDCMEKYTRKNRLQFPINNKNIVQLNKEPRSLSGKILFYLTFSRDITPDKLKDSKYSQDLLSLISALAHYIKLISRTGIMLALELNKASNSRKPTDLFLREISLGSKTDRASVSNFPHLEGVTTRSRDYCVSCDKSIEDSCAVWNGSIGGVSISQRWHYSCLKCSKCNKGFNAKLNSANSKGAESLTEAVFNPKTNKVLCASCGSQDVDAHSGFKDVSKLLQFIYLLKIALLRSRSALSKSHVEFPNKKSFTAEDGYDKQVNDITRRRSIREGRQLQHANQEIQKFRVVDAPQGIAAGNEDILDVDSAANTSADSEGKLSRIGSTRKYLKRQESLASNKTKQPNDFRVENVPKSVINVNATITSKILLNEQSLTLDDIARIVSTEQAREYRPNAFRFQKRNFSPAFASLPKSKSVNKRDNPSEIKEVVSKPGLELKCEDESSSVDLKNVKRYSDLNYLGHEYMRHVAAFVLYEFLKGEYPVNLDDCLSIVSNGTDSGKKNASFWGKLFGKDKDTSSSSNGTANNEFKSGSATTLVTGNGVFGVSLETVVKNYGVDSDLGVGESRIRIPSLIDELIHAMQKQNLSAEGVFRLNGNIKRLRKLVEELDGKHGKPDIILQKMKLSEETPIQLAAILKKFLRDLPIPLMTYKLYDVFILSQKIGKNENSEDKKFQRRDKLLKIAYAMLPKANRDLTEVLLSFLAWVATFAYLESTTGEADGGSKMDTHNLATVLTPNILYESMTPTKPTSISMINQKVGGGVGESQFLSIEVIHEMIENNDDLTVIPTGIYKLFRMSGFDNVPGVAVGGGVMSTMNGTVKVNKEEKDSILNSKEIIAKIRHTVDLNPYILKECIN